MSEIRNFFTALGCKNPGKVAKELDKHDVHNLDDLANLDDDDRAELAEELKSAGFSIGDRGKVKRATVDEITKFRSKSTCSQSSGDTGAKTKKAASPAKLHKRESTIALPPHFDQVGFAHLEKTVLDLVSDKKNADKLWHRLDANGNGKVSLAELDKFVIENFPQLNNKKALIRAHHQATFEDGDGDEWIQRHEFEMLVVNLFYFNKLAVVFSSIDKSGDGRVDFEEFVQGLDVIGFGISRDDAWHEFCKMDEDRGGLVLFEEFCTWVAAQMWPGGAEEYFKSRAKNVGAALGSPKKIHGRVSGTTGLDFEPDIHTTKYDQLEMEVLGHCSSQATAKKMFKSIDADKNGKISQKEFITWVEKRYPSLTDKEAITFAFKKTIHESEDGDKYVQPDEFKELFVNLFYFTKLKFVFNKMDKNHDKKLSFHEFAKGLMWVGLTMNTADALKEFDTIDAACGGDGEIDFNEFCTWVVSKRIPVD